MNERFSVARWWGVVRKEFLQLRRDRVTFAMIIGIPIIQMTLFGFAINTDPKHLPTAVIAADQSEFTRSFIAALRNSDYFDIVATLPDEESGRRALVQGRVLFVVDIPPGFTRELVKGAHPSLLVEADATDSTAVGTSLGALPSIVQSVLQKDLTGPLSSLAVGPAAFDVRIHRLYNPEGITQYNVVPGLMGVILTMTMVMMTGLAITRERERGTMENLLATPVLPIEVTTANILLSGFMFPFAGMPRWAQAIGNALPLTYFNRLVRGILLKGAGWADLWPHVWPMLIFMFVVMAIAVRFYRRTLD